MDELLELLKKNDIEVTDDLEISIENIWPEVPDTDDLFSQDELNDIVKKRLAREQKLHEQEIEDLKKEMEGLVDPEKVEEYETKIEELEGKAKEREAELLKDYELKLAAANAGVDDQEYFEFLVDKKGLKDRLQVGDEGNVLATDKDGNILTEDGNKLGPGVLVNELKEEKPGIVGNKDDDQDIGGDSNPGSDNDTYKTAAELAKDRSNPDKQQSDQNVKNPWNN